MRAEVTAAVEAAMEELEVPGVAIAVLADGEVDAAALGVTSIDNPLPVTPETLFQAGSITKTVTATAALRLQEEGLLDLDDPVRKLVPELRLADPDVAERVTLRHLLTHAGGRVGDWFDDLGWGDDVLARSIQVPEQLPQLSPLGELWSYNNAGFYAAGRVLEVAAGLPYEEVVRTLVLEPIGMERSYMFPWEVMTERFAVGHLGSGDEQSVARPWPVPRLSSAAGAARHMRARPPRVCTRAHGGCDAGAAPGAAARDGHGGRAHGARVVPEAPARRALRRARRDDAR